ncbi:MAG: NAD(P)/FAD-dependent oxidoreductase [Gammaproteobacteria bacterium]|nr:NAD(P)/FAD-dependent oxidoreductase [Gammaproteobacteria bacterium]
MAIESEVVIVGAGPCGLFQVFELGLLGIKAHVIDSLPSTGGQCSTLYPEKPIYDIPAIPVCAAQELVDKLEQQIKPFDAEFHLEEIVVQVHHNDDGSFNLKTSTGTEFHTKVIIIAGGLGSFEPRPLRLKGIVEYEGINLSYKVTDKEKYRGKHLVILGGGDSALDWTLDLYEESTSLTLIHRREEFRAAPASVAKMKQLCEENGDKIRYLIARVKGFQADQGQLTGLEVQTPDDEVVTVELEELLVFYGLSPNLGPIAEWGLEIDKRQIKVDTEKYQTNIPGIFAIGDINTYPGKKKLILSGFHEAALAAFAIEKHLYPDKRQFMQYTTTSTVLHERLGVSGSME